MRIAPEHVPTLLRRSGVVGAGGAGFPTYVKYQRPTRTLIANGTESEPGYYGDKLLMQEQPDVLCRALSLLRDVLGYERVYCAVKQKHAEYAAEVARYAEETGDFGMVFVPDQYRMGEEKALTRFVTGETVPRGAIPPKIGVTVQNTETLHNVYWALTEHRPVLYKVLQTLGEVEHSEVVQAPVGTPVGTVFAHAGHPKRFVAQKAETLRLIDGGPLLGDVIHDPALHIVQKTTNGLLAVDPEHFRDRGRYYPHPGVEPPTHISVIADEVDAVEVPLRGRLGDPAIPVVSEGDKVFAGQEVGAYDPDTLSVSVHASIPGVVTRIDERVRIERQP